MAIRLRIIPGIGWLALCAARSVEKPGDLYLDDSQHMALSRKYWQDYPEIGITAEADVLAATDAEESNNPNRDWWDREYPNVAVRPVVEEG